MVSPMVKESANLDSDMRNSPVSRNRKRKNAGKQKKVRITAKDEPSTSRVNVEVTSEDCNTEGEMTLVRRKRRNRKKKDHIMSEATSGGETDVSTRRKKQKLVRNQKIQCLKDKTPDKVFTIEVSNKETVDSARKSIWSDIVKKNKAPKIARQTVINKGDSKFIRIVAVDEDTYSTLKSITEIRTDINLQPSKQPMVMIYDIDKTLTPEEIDIGGISFPKIQVWEICSVQ